MRKALVDYMLKIANSEDIVFITCDLGFGFLEPLREAMGDRFINAGVAEQNAVSLAAGLARGGMRPFVYSISPFLYARAFEQIRNDVCMNGLPVTFLANGGGMGYGPMGPTHHSMEDYGVLKTLEDFSIYVPAFDEDVPEILDLVEKRDIPAWVRLGIDEKPKGFSPPRFDALRCLHSGRSDWAIIVVGPLVGSIWGALDALELSPIESPSLWVASEISESVVIDFDFACPCQYLLIVEEHTNLRSSGFSSMVSEHFVCRDLKRFVNLPISSCDPGASGSQKFLRKNLGIDGESVIRFVMDNMANDPA